MYFLFEMHPENAMLLVLFIWTVLVWKPCHATWAEVSELELEPSSVWSIHNTCLPSHHAHKLFKCTCSLHSHYVLAQTEQLFVKVNCNPWYKNVVDLYESSEKQGFIFHSDSKAVVNQSRYTESIRTGYIQVTYRCSRSIRSHGRK